MLLAIEWLTALKQNSALPNSGSSGGPHFDKQPFAMSERMPLTVEDRSFDPVFASFVPDDPPLHANLHARRNWAPVIDFHVARHCGKPARSNSLAHGFIQQCRNDSTVKESRVSLEEIRNHSRTHHGAILGEKELQLKPLRIGFAAAKAAVLGSMRQGSKVIEVRFHHCAISPESTRAKTSASTLPPVRTTPIRLP